MERNTRPVMTRIYYIDKAIRSGAHPDAATLADCLEVSRRTVERDIEQMRDFFGAPIAFDRSSQGYRYERPFSLPALDLTAGELTVLLIGQRLLAETAGTPFAGMAKQVMDKLPMLLPDKISLAANPLDGEISFGLPQVRGDQTDLGRHFNLLAEAINQGRTVSMLYHTLTRDVTTDRLVDPYHLHQQEGAWYLIGHCHHRGRIRVFAVDRIVDAVITEAAFVRPDGFNAKDYLDHSWGMELGPEYTVRVRFAPRQARWIRERVWQEGQKLTDTPEGGVILEIKARGLGAIKRWVLGFGRFAKVLEPPELAAMIREEAAGIMKNYEF